MTSPPEPGIDGTQPAWTVPWSRFERFVARSLEIVRAPRVTIEVYGDEEARAIYRSFTARHRRFKVTGAKRWGVALIRLPDSFAEYLGGGSKTLLRRKRRLADSNGFRYATLRPLDYLDDIMAINRSASTRQGRPMPASYLDSNLVRRSLESLSQIHGILDRSGRLRAYAVIPDIGDAIVFGRLLGHADDVELGVMYLLVSEVIRQAVEARASNGTPIWAMYDTLWGALPGLAHFKRRLGFEPYVVTWRWVDADTRRRTPHPE
jgi:hypothetical protein